MKLASQQHQHEARNLQHKAGITSTLTRSWKSSTRSWHHNNISTKLEIFSTRLASQQQQHEAGNIQHKVGITTSSALSWKSSAQGWHHNISMKLEIFSTRLASTLLPLSKEVLSDYTKLISKVLKLYTRQRLGQHICNLLIRANILELYGSSLHHITDVMISDFYVF
jgi:hypothetical protein